MNTYSVRYICATLILLAGGWFANDVWHSGNNAQPGLVVLTTLLVFTRVIPKNDK